METTTLEPRIANPAFAVPGAMDALMAMNKAISRVGISERTLELMHLRASQINGCGVNCQWSHQTQSGRVFQSRRALFSAVSSPSLWGELASHEDAGLRVCACS